MDCLNSNTVKNVLTTNSEQWPPVYNNYPESPAQLFDYKIWKFTSYFKSTSEQQAAFDGHFLEVPRVVFVHTW